MVRPMSEMVERSSLDLRYEGYRLRNEAAEARLLASIVQRGIEEPLSGVDRPQGRLLLDGFRRNRCAAKLGIECVPYVSWGEDETQWQLPFRCKICPDGIGEAADIAAADTWPGGAPTREGSVDDPGTNAIIARTAAGLELMEAAERDGALTIDYDITPDEMSHYQPHQMRKKYAVWARHQGLGDEGRIVPETNRLRIAELAAELPASHSDYQRAGTRRRVQDGKVSEPAPEILK